MAKNYYCILLAEPPGSRIIRIFADKADINIPGSHARFYCEDTKVGEIRTGIKGWWIELSDQEAYTEALKGSWDATDSVSGRSSDADTGLAPMEESY